MNSPCSCSEHTGKFCLVSYKDYAGLMHDYQLHEDHRGWRFLCSCGKRCQFNRQSPNVPYHSWLVHIQTLPVLMDEQDDLDRQIDKIHGPGAAAALKKAYEDGSLFSQ